MHPRLAELFVSTPDVHVRLAIVTSVSGGTCPSAKWCGAEVEDEGGAQAMPPRLGSITRFARRQAKDAQHTPAAVVSIDNRRGFSVSHSHPWNPDSAVSTLSPPIDVVLRQFETHIRRNQYRFS